MRKKYTVTLFIIALLLVATLTVGTGYGVWLSSKQTEETNTRSIECFKIYYENDGVIEISKIKPVVNSDGEETSPYTVTITNTCAEKKEVQVRLNTIDSTTIDVNALVLKTSGNIINNAILYKNLETTKTNEEGIKVSKLLGKMVVEPNETIRTNIRIWFDEKKAPNVDDTNNYFKGHIEIISSDNAIKPTLLESILKDKAGIESKGNPNFNEIAYNDEGLYAMDASNGKYYYYRGVALNNYVVFSNNTWRIVGINPDGTVKLILDTPATIARYSDNYKYEDYTGFTYEYANSQVNNEINKFLLNWYKTNIEAVEDEYVVNYNFCNDTSSRDVGSKTYFGAYDRILTNIKPTLNCPSSKNDFGGTYNQKIGLITADEVVLAGGLVGTNNYSYYLYNGTSFFTASPSSHISNVANMIIVDSNGSIKEDRTNSEQGIRPVINVVGNVTFEGSGTKDNPYVLDLK